MNPDLVFIYAPFLYLKKAPRSVNMGGVVSTITRSRVRAQQKFEHHLQYLSMMELHELWNSTLETYMKEPDLDKKRHLMHRVQQIQTHLVWRLQDRQNGSPPISPFESPSTRTAPTALSVSLSALSPSPPSL